MKVITCLRPQNPVEEVLIKKIIPKEKSVDDTNEEIQAEKTEDKSIRGQLISIVQLEKEIEDEINYDSFHINLNELDSIQRVCFFSKQNSSIFFRIY
jgi:hypothetical protein